MATLIFPNGKQISKIDLIMMDKDGTIFDIHHYWCSMIRLRSKIIAEKYTDLENYSKLFLKLCQVMGVDHNTNKLRPEGPIGIKPRKFITEVVSKCLLENDIQLSGQAVEDIFKLADRESEESLSDFLSILDGVHDFIGNCEDQGIILTIATTDIESRAITALKSKDLQKHFRLVFGADSVTETKPAPFMANRTLEELQVDRERAVMVGDHTVDITFSNNANLKAAIGVSTGLLAAEELKKIY